MNIVGPLEFMVTALAIVALFIVVEWFRDWRDFPRISPSRDKTRPPVQLHDIDDGRPRPSVTDVDDLTAEVSCGGDIGGDAGGD